jgi:16S rRNA C967 or C1407 C5-methylase (RsmB/RsmF family)
VWKSIKNQKELNQWKPSRSKFLAQKQYSLLSGALVAAKPNARIIYSTCSLSKEENDEVIHRLLEKKSEIFKIFLTPSSPTNFNT